MVENQKYRWVLLAIAVLASILVPFALFGEAIEAWTQEFLASTSDRLPLVAAVLSMLLATDIILPVPSSVVSVAAGMFLGFLWGTLASLTGMTISCLAGYWLGSKFGRPLVTRICRQWRIGKGGGNEPASRKMGGCGLASSAGAGRGIRSICRDEPDAGQAFCDAGSAV